MAYAILANAAGGLDPDELTARAEDVLAGVLAGVKGNDEPVLGTMPKRAANTMAVNQTISSGYMYIRIPKGAYVQASTSGYPQIQVPTTNLGNAKADEVIAGKIFTSSTGLKVAGTMQPITGDYLATHVATIPTAHFWAHPNGNRGVVMHVGANRPLAKGVDFVFANEPNLLASNIRAGTTMFNVAGSLEDFASQQMVFNGASFFGFMKEGAIIRSTRANVSSNLMHNNMLMSYLDQGITHTQEGQRFTGGRLWNGFTVRPNSDNAAGGFTTYKSVFMSLFRQVRITVQIDLHEQADSFLKMRASVYPIDLNTRRVLPNYYAYYSEVYGAGLQAFTIDTSGLNGWMFFQLVFHVYTQRAGGYSLTGEYTIKSIEFIR